MFDDLVGGGGGFFSDLPGAGNFDISGHDYGFTGWTQEMEQNAQRQRNQQKTLENSIMQIGSASSPYLSPGYNSSGNNTFPNRNVVGGGNVINSDIGTWEGQGRGNWNNTLGFIGDQAGSLLRGLTGSTFIPSSGEINPQNIMQYGSAKERANLYDYLLSGKAGDVNLEPIVTKSGQALLAPRGLSTAQNIANPVIAGINWAAFGGGASDLATTPLTKALGSALDFGVANAAQGGATRYGETGSLAEATNPKAVLGDLLTGGITGLVFKGPGQIKSAAASRAALDIAENQKGLATALSSLHNLASKATPTNRSAIVSAVTKAEKHIDALPVAPATKVQAKQGLSEYLQERMSAQRTAEKGDTGNRLVNAKNEVAQKAVDIYSPIEAPLREARKQGLISPLNDITPQIDRAIRSGELAGQYIKDSGFDKVIQGIDNTKAFDQYLIAKRSLEVGKKGIETGRSAAKDAQLVKELAPHYEAQAQQVNAFTRQLLDKAVEYGLVSKEVATKLKRENPSYVPLERIFSEGELPNTKGVGGGKASLSSQSVVQGIKGSKREIQSPLESILAKVNDVYSQGERNKAASILASYKDLPGNPLNITPLRTAENVKARIDLYSQAKDLKPVQNLLDRLTKTRSGWVRKLRSEINSLNKQALEKTLRSPGTSAIPEFSVSGLKELSTKDTRSFVNSLVNMPRGEIEALKRKIATRENKLGPLLDEVASLSDALEGVKATRGQLFDEAKLLRDAESKGLSTISVLKDGIKEIYQTTPEIATAAKNLSPTQLGLLGKILSYPTRLLRLGATGLNPAFAAANVVKDLGTAFVNSKRAASSLANPHVFLEALSAAFHHKGAKYAELVREGAAGTSFDIARDSVKTGLKQIRAEKNIGTKALYTVRHPSELLRAVENTIGRSEEFGRAAQYYGNKRALLKEGLSQAEARTMAAHEARNVTVNFARAGEYGRVLNTTLPYLNAGIQGSRTFLRNMKERPIQTGAKTAVYAFLPVAATTAWALSDPKRKEAWDSINDYEKQNNIIIVPPNPTRGEDGRWNVIKIPMSQEIANLSNIVRQGVEAMHNNKPLDFAQIAGDLVGTATSLNAQNPRQLMGQLTPQALKPGYEALTNQNLFTGNTIVPDAIKNLAPKDQYNSSTSGLAKVLGNIFNASPLHIDNAIKTATGGLGQNLTNVADTLLAKAGVIRPDEVQGKDFLSSIAQRFTSAQGTTPASEFFTSVDNAAKNAKLGGKELAFLNSILSKEIDPNGKPIKNDWQDSIAKNAILLTNPHIMEVLGQAAKDLKNKTGREYDPIYDLTPDQQKSVLAIRAQLPGSDDWAKKALHDTPWYQQFAQKEKDFFNSLKDAKGNLVAQGGGSEGTAYQPSTSVQQYYDQINQKRKDIGLLTPDRKAQEYDMIQQGAANAKTLGEKLAYMQNVKLAGFDMYDKFFAQNPQLNPVAAEFQGFKKGYGRSGGGGSRLAKVKIKVAKTPKFNSRLAKSLFKVKKLPKMVG